MFDPAQDLDQDDDGWVDDSLDVSREFAASLLRAQRSELPAFRSLALQDADDVGFLQYDGASPNR